MRIARASRLNLLREDAVSMRHPELVEGSPPVGAPINEIERSDSLPHVGEGGPWNTVDEAVLGANEYILQNIVIL